MDNRSRENFLIHVMNTGFERAAASFSRLIGRPVKITSSQSILVRHDHELSCISEEEGDLIILVTQIIGDISGKSFLIFNHEESSEIFRTLNFGGGNKELHEAFLLEIDNIISASVIAVLSNSLGIEVYGDVPHLIKIHSRDLQTYMQSEITKDDPSTMIFTNTTFYFQSHERVNPQFIWKLNSKIFDMIPLAKIPA
jgi:Chemotaxis protein CheC, inhibitor of MCP methylation